MKKIGIIGCGNRITGVYRLLWRLNPEGVKLAAVVDPDPDGVKERIGKQMADQVDGIEFFDTPEAMLEGADLDGLMIGTRCSHHTELACKVEPSGLPLYLEKPVAINMEQASQLYKAYKGKGDRVVVSFPLRLTQHVIIAKQIIDSGVMGPIRHIQAINNVTYGDTYWMNWYRSHGETSGQWLQKATHDLDYINAIMGVKPVRLAAMHSQGVYGPDGVHGPMPEGQDCNSCPKQKECPESPYNRFYMRGLTDKVEENTRHCAFAPDAMNEDNGSCLVEYENGVHAMYSQNFFARRDAGQRGATLIAYGGTISFDWYSNKLKVVYHHRDRTEDIDLASKHGHGGGDVELVKSFMEVMLGEAPSISTLDDGVLSAYMCLKAKESANTGEFKKLDVTELG